MDRFYLNMKDLCQVTVLSRYSETEGFHIDVPNMAGFIKNLVQHWHILLKTGAAFYGILDNASKIVPSQRMRAALLLLLNADQPEARYGDTGATQA
jgi:hypothetical protein